MTHPTTLAFVNPATGEQFGQIQTSTPADVTEALQDLRHTFQTWSTKPLGARLWALARFKDSLIDRADEIAAVLNRDCGKTRQDGLVEVFITVDALSRILRQANGWLARKTISPGIYIFKRYYQLRVPYGVVAVLGPWNYPFVQVMTPILAALAAGNTVAVKPSEITPAVSELIDRLFGEFPELHPYVRVLHGGPEIGKALVEAPPDLIFLTGSVGTAEKIAAAAAPNLTPFIYELGGKDPMIVLEDADIQQAARWGVWAANYNSGQVCMSVERVYVVEAVYDAFVKAVEEEIKRFKIGYTTAVESPYDSGPLTTKRQLDIVVEHVREALEKGARALTGGRHEGLFYEPTVLVDVDHGMKVTREETFGPVMPIMRVRDAEEALALANDSEYGLCGYIWSRDIRRAEALGRRLRVGSVVVNDAMAHYAVSSLPFGGVKKSGNGRIHGEQEVLQFTQIQSFAAGPPPLPFDIATIFRSPGRYRPMMRVLKLVFGNGRQKIEAIFPDLGEPARPIEPRPVPFRANGLAVKTAAAAGVAAAAIAVLTIGRRR